MNYIVNPSVFCWFNVLNALHGVAVGLMVLLIVLLLVLAVVTITSIDMWDDDERQRMVKWIKVVIIALSVSIIGVVFLPDKQTLVEMLVAKYATVDNANWTLDAVKSAVDYIVEAMKAIK